MKMDYSPSKLSRRIRLLVAILLPVVVTVVFLLVLGMDKDSLSLLVVCLGCSLMGSGIILLSSYYPVFLQDRLVIRNDIIPSMSKEYRYIDIEYVKVRQGQYGIYVMNVHLKDEECYVQHFLCLTSEKFESVNAGLRELGIPESTDRNISTAADMKSVFLKSAPVKFFMLSALGVIVLLVMMMSLR